MKKHIFLLVFSIFCSAKMTAQHQPPTTQSVSIFKNGQAFFIKSVALTATNGKFLLPGPIPEALYGTLWFSSPKGTLTKISSYPDTLREKKTEQSVAIWDLLRANIGKKVAGLLDDKGNVTGTLISVGPSHTNEQGEPQFSAQSLVTIQAPQTGWITIPAGQIRYVAFSEIPNLEMETTKTTPRHLLEATFSSNKTEQPLDMMYLANGLNWAPQYLLELTGENTGTLTMQGEVANDAEDLWNTTVNLVVGVPNFAYANRLSYLVDFLNVIMPAAFQARRDFNQFSNALATQQATMFSAEETPSGPEEPEGSRNEDLYFYTLRNFSLPKGGRSMQHIFKEKVEVAHIYECRLPGNNDNDRSLEPDFLFTPQKNKLYHTLRLENRTNQPWTTASILVMNTKGTGPIGASRPVSQDLLAYTPIGGKTFVKLTEAVEVKVEQAEREVSRQNAALADKRYGIAYDLVLVEGKIKVKNFKDSKLDLRIQRTITGILKYSNVNWQQEETVNPGTNRNRKTNVIWETPINASGEVEITYTYQVYLPAI